MNHDLLDFLVLTPIIWVILSIPVYIAYKRGLSITQQMLVFVSELALWLPALILAISLKPLKR